ncbi:hypothetical protein SPRG_19798 [Saprolegnia parasitica CBS 223.65]|uniref:DnaJ homologue subfamily C GRV2/DNAJC13 N-terminal domain-containing protein n=1 Tax=Saprolegnia parasitica (strain CBS 223.65) TaxID=695850 RepID=A0A067CUQ9_SAPPC|nr:hypothetical protein SPRG_19798 [Saprolegnia parasitica CBS 223.65]KDO30246.1 hypothetical protein SPRG_19798 [Saprolegnia parasitica CBS 223.65]|eukprot:XP_012199051.1 hypothetical protein SPRG_19798 [Saprolegnia parasitica CBS 223.65]
MVDPTFTDKFLVVKVKWSGKQERILGLRAYTFATLHPKTGAITNEWSYEAISSIELSHEDKTEFTINMPGLKKKVQLKMRFRFRAEVLQALARARASFSMERRSRNMNVLAKLTSFAAHVEVFVPDAADPGRIQCTLAECMLQVGVDAVYQTGGTADIFPYAEFTKIQCIDLALDDPTLLGIVAGDMVHIFHTSAPNDVVRAILDAALSHDVSVAINRETTASDIQAQHMQFAGFTDGGILCRYDVQIPILLEDGQSELYGRSFLLTDSVVCEMDDGNIVAFAQPLTKLFELVRHEDDPQAFDLEFVNGLRRTYLSIHREAILGHLLSCCEARGNLVPLTKTRTPRGDRMFLRRMLHAPAAVPSEAVQYQSMWLQRLVGGGDSKADSGKAKSPSIFQTLKVHRGSGSKPETGIPVGDMVAELNANVTIAGVSSKLKEDIGAAVSLLLGELPNHVMRTAQRDMSVVSSYLQALYRLVTHPNAAKVALDMLSRSEYMDAMAETLKRQQFHPTYWVLRLMARLLHNSERFLAQMARKVFLSHNGFATALLALFQPLHPSPHGDPQQNAVLVMRLTEVLDALMSFVVDGMAVDPLFNILLSHVSMHYFMLLRTLFHFPVTSTVESIVCILDHMVHSSVLNFTKTHEATLRDLGQDLAGDFYMESPERIIKQYYSFLMASTPTRYHSKCHTTPLEQNG